MYWIGWKAGKRMILRLDSLNNMNDIYIYICNSIKKLKIRLELKREQW